MVSRLPLSLSLELFELALVLVRLDSIPLLRISASFRVTLNPTLRINGYESHQPNREPQATDSRRPPETASRMGSAKRRIPNVRCLRGAAHGSARTCAQPIYDARPNGSASVPKSAPRLSLRGRAS